jgi:hypothetical protein
MPDIGNFLLRFLVLEPSILDATTFRVDNVGGVDPG